MPVCSIKSAPFEVTSWGCFRPTSRCLPSSPKPCRNGRWRGFPGTSGNLLGRKGVLKGCSDVISELKRELAGVDEVCIATDVDPSGEGELLAWEALEKCGWHGKTSRMYFTDEAPVSVQKAFKGRKMLGAMEEDGDFVKAHVRERWDLASMQFVRAATCIARDHGFRTVVREGA